MRTHPLRANLPLILACLVTVLLFFLSLAGAGSHLWGWYLLSIIVAFLWGRRRDIYIVTALASVLVIAEHWTDGSDLGDLLVNHLLPILILWGAAWLLARRYTELRASTERFRKLFRTNPGGIAITRQSDGRFLEANDAYLAMVGFTREQLIGRTSRDLGILTAEQRDLIKAAIMENGSVRGMDVQMRNAQGQTVDAAYSAEQLEFGGESCFLILAIDMTERTRLAAYTRRLAAIVEASHEAIVSADLDGTVISVNPGAEDLYGVPAPLAVGRNIAALIPPQNAADFQALLGRVAAGEAVNADAAAWPLPDGTTKILSVSVSPIRDGAGRVTSFAALARDVTARQTAEHKYRDLYDNSPDMYLVSLPTQERIVDCNQTLARTLGYTREELVGSSTSILFAPASFSLMQAGRTEFLAEGKSKRFDVQLQCKDGTLLDVIMSGSLDLDPAGGPPVARSTFHDITERKRLEERLRDSEARLRAVIENTVDSVWSVDRNYCLLVANTAFAQSVQQQIGRPLAPGQCVVADPFPLSVRAFWQSLYDRALAGEAFRLEMPSDLQPGGTLACYLHPIYAADGTIVGVSGRAADITPVKVAEAQLREAYQRLQLATAAADIGIWNWNFASSSLDWDNRMCELYAVTAAERAAGISYDLWRSRIHPDDLALAEPAQGDPNRIGSEKVQTYRILLPGGTVCNIQASFVMEYDRDAVPLRIIGINRDITDQMRYQQFLQDTNSVLEEHVAARTAELQAALADLQRAGKLKDEFLAMISHELRTPLMGVLSMSEMLADQIAGPLSDRQLTYVAAITYSGERLLNLVNGILGYTHLLSGKLQLNPEPCDLAFLLNTCAVSQRHKAAAKQQTIAVVVDPPDITLTVDDSALVEVIKRLLDNAVKFTPDGGQIGLEAHPGAAPQTVDLVVWDTGVGIAADQFEYVFQAFTQADARLARSHEGIGLGLAYIDAMVRLMGGRIALESAPGKGSRFTITLPV